MRRNVIGVVVYINVYVPDIVFFFQMMMECKEIEYQKKLKQLRIKLKLEFLKTL